MQVSGGRGRLALALLCTGTQLWVTGVHTEHVEETFCSRIDQDV